MFFVSIWIELRRKFFSSKGGKQKGVKSKGGENSILKFVAFPTFNDN